MVSNKEKNQKEWRTMEIVVPLSEGVSAEYVGNNLVVKGPKGEISKRLRYPRVDINVEGNEVKISTNYYTKRAKKIIHTYRAHVRNLDKGVTEGFTYRLTVVFSKFPVTVEFNAGVFTVKNLLGEKQPRSVSVPDDVKVEIKGGKEIEVTGIDKERTGQVAALLEQTTRITHLDRRVIQDGIYIVEKPHVRYV